MGSFFAGIKAGTLGGVAYLGGLALFNVFLLYALKADVLNVIAQNPSQICTTGGTTNSVSVEQCFSLVVAFYVPFTAFVGFLISLVFAGVFGQKYDRFPGRRSIIKGMGMAAIVGIIFLSSPYWLGLNLVGFFFDYKSTVLVSVFFFLWTILYGYVLGRLYRRYTRIVRFESLHPASVRVLVGGRDYTGKEVTLAHTSTHQVRAEVAGDASFKEWTVSGGITVDDPRSFETAFEVSGDGLLKAQASKKY